VKLGFIWEPTVNHLFKIQRDYATQRIALHLAPQVSFKSMARIAIEGAIRGGTAQSGCSRPLRKGGGCGNTRPCC